MIKHLIRRDGRVVECDGLENRCGASHPGFESQSLRRNEVFQEERCKRANIVRDSKGASKEFRAKEKLARIVLLERNPVETEKTQGMW